jgi:hypothetical protein
MKIRLALIIAGILLSLVYTSANTELLGDLSKEDIIKKFPSWEERAAVYMPDLDSIAKLQSFNSLTVNIEVYLGTWCPDSVEHVSSFFKIMEMADNPRFLVTYTGIPRDKPAREAYIQGKVIQKVPTFILTTNGQEIGRIIEHPQKSVEEDLADILMPQL